MSWSIQENFKKDLYDFSENQTSPNDEPEQLPVTIAQWKALRGANREQSIYDTIPYETDVTILSSGRGRGRRSEIYRPGAPVINSNSSEDDEIKRRLLEVNSHSYSNVNIEAAIKMKKRLPQDDELCDALEPNSKNNVPSRINSSIKESSPINKCSSSSSSPVISDEVQEKPSLLPLSQMLQIARQKPRKKLFSQALKEKPNLPKNE